MALMQVKVMFCRYEFEARFVSLLQGSHDDDDDNDDDDEDDATFSSTDLGGSLPAWTSPY